MSKILRFTPTENEIREAGKLVRQRARARTDKITKAQERERTFSLLARYAGALFCVSERYAKIENPNRELSLTNGWVCAIQTRQDPSAGYVVLGEDPHNFPADCALLILPSSSDPYHSYECDIVGWTLREHFVQSYTLTSIKNETVCILERSNLIRMTVLLCTLSGHKQGRGRIHS